MIENLTFLTFPMGTHLFCSNHLQQDLIRYLKGKANCNATDISFFVQSFKQLLSEETEESFDQMWSTLKDGRQFECNKNVLNYFENRLLPTFKAHSSIWILKGAGIVKILS